MILPNKPKAPEKPKVIIEPPKPKKTVAELVLQDDGAEKKTAIPETKPDWKTVIPKAAVESVFNAYTKSLRRKKFNKRK